MNANPSANRSSSQPLDKKTFWIGILTLSAAVLLAAHAMQPASLLPTAQAEESVESRNYAMATAEAPDGGEVLYVLDKRSGGLGLFVWDAQGRRPVLVNARPVTDAFRR